MQIPSLACLFALVGLSGTATVTAEDNDPFVGWTEGVKVAPVSTVAGRHTIHTYYLTNPESPDGKHILFFASSDPRGEKGEIRMLERATGRETVLAAGVVAEDAHRVACQQWLAGGRLVAYHEVVEDRWRVLVVDVETLEKTVVVEDRQVGFGRPEGDLLPLYGCHWNPGEFRDLYLWSAATRAITIALPVSAVETAHRDWLAEEFADKPISIFFPVLSPDSTRVFFKIAAGNGGNDFRSKRASQRQGIVSAELAGGQLEWFRAQWGHPAWYPDSRRIFEMGNVIFDTREPSTKYTKLKDVPPLRGSHPSISPDARLMVTDGMTDPIRGAKGEWGIQIADLGGGRSVIIDTFDQTQGAKSWRRNDPHPAFSADGRRIYYNVSDGEFTRLFVAEKTAE